MKRVGMGLIGPGFIATQHVDAVRRLGYVDLVAVAGSSLESARRKAGALGAARAYDSYLDLIADPDVEVIHNTTPNYLHFPIAMAALAARKHIISDKPLAITAQEGRALRDAALKAGVAHVVTFNYRGNPLVQEARAVIAKGDAGELRFIHGFYLQDWMADANVYSWRSDPAKGGPTSALGDIGSHWCDLAEHISGMQIEAVLANLTTTMPVRYTTGTSAEAFSAGAAEERTPVQVTSEDLASVLLRLRGGAQGCFSVAQTLPGHKNDLQIELCGSRMSLQWKQERQNELVIGHRDQPNQLLAKDPSLLSATARYYTHLPGGHQEGWSDAFFNIIQAAYDWVREGGRPEAKPAILPTFVDGCRSACLVEAILQSHAAGGRWTSVGGTDASHETCS
jgi:predicted dehydrogenase